MAQWQKHLAPIQFKPDYPVYRVKDGTIDLALLSGLLVARAERLGVKLTQQRVQIEVRGNAVSSLRLDNHERVAISPQEHVVLAAGARIRSILNEAGIIIPSLKVYQSHLIATNVLNVGVLAVAHGITNAVPHKMADGSITTLFGNAGRTELPPEADGKPLQPNPVAVDSIRNDVHEWFGVEIPSGFQTWPAVKTEIVYEGSRSQEHQAHLVPGLTNTWLAIPGKLSQSAACSLELATMIARRVLADDNRTDPLAARPIWDAPDDNEDAAATAVAG